MLRSCEHLPPTTTAKHRNLLAPLGAPAPVSAPCLTEHLLICVSLGCPSVLRMSSETCYQICLSLLGLLLQSTTPCMTSGIGFCSLLVLEARSPTSTCQRGWFLLRALGKATVPGLFPGLVDGCLLLILSHRLPWVCPCLGPHFPSS